ncbi:MAG: hypothetical protein WD270_11990, partial [Acetobacterales bacterium]
MSMIQTIVAHVGFGIAAAFAAAALATLAIRLIGGSGRGAQLAGAGIGIGVLTFLSIWFQGLPEVSARHLHHLVPYAVAAGLLIGLAVDAAAPGRGVRAAVTLLCSAVAVWWLLGAPFAGVARLAFLYDAAPLFAAWAVVLLRLGRPVEDARSPAVMLAMAALGVAGLAWLNGGDFYLLAALAVAASALGFLVWNWPGPRFAFGSAALLGGGGALMALVTAQWLSRMPAALGLALLALGLVFFADGVAARMRLGSGLVRQILSPLQLALLAAFPVALALVVGYLAV